MISVKSYKLFIKIKIKNVAHQKNLTIIDLTKYGLKIELKFDLDSVLYLIVAQAAYETDPYEQE